jgi:hypothetical protein
LVLGGSCRERFLPPAAGTGRAQPCPIAWPWLSVTVTHQVERGLRAAAARSRARSESPGAVHGMINVQVLGLAAAVRDGRSRFGGGRGVAVVAERGFGDDPGL